jgi:tetratricopeptide (TPR) repeat protein
MIKCIYVSLLIVAVSAFTGCATHAPSTPPPPVEERPVEAPPAEPAVVTPPVVVVPKPAPVVAPPNPAVLSLSRQARSQYQARDYQGAIATAERGLRIERRAAELYLVLAQSYLQLALPEKAKMFVQQGLRFAPQGSETSNSLLSLQSSVK